MGSYDNTLKSGTDDNSHKSGTNESETSNSIPNDCFNHDCDNNSLSREEIYNKSSKELYHIFNLTIKN